MAARQKYWHPALFPNDFSAKIDAGGSVSPANASRAPT
jgi:hypothetical protein